MRLIVTNFNPRFTGVSATIATLVPLLAQKHDVFLCGKPLDGCSAPITFREAVRLSRSDGAVIWHVRRNNEMLAALFVRDVLRLPIKIVFTSAAIRRHSAFPRWLISRMDAVVATSDAAAMLVPNVVATIPHGVDLAKFKPVPDKPTAWAALKFGGKAGFITVGRVRPEKGTDIFVEAMVQLLPKLPDYQAVIIGKTTAEFRVFRERLEAKILLSGLTGRINFANERPATQMPEIMAAASLLFALPRYEGYGLTVLEAMASGTPVIATDAGEFRRFVGESEAGVVLNNPGNSSIVTVAMKLACDDQNISLRCHAARQRASLFGAEIEAQALADVYTKLGSLGL